MSLHKKHQKDAQGINSPWTSGMRDVNICLTCRHYDIDIKTRRRICDLGRIDEIIPGSKGCAHCEAYKPDRELLAPLVAEEQIRYDDSLRRLAWLKRQYRRAQDMDRED